jgi:RimJ/RimL family protein N-acetyltransferase
MGVVTRLPAHRQLRDDVVTLRQPDERDVPAIDAGIHDDDVVRWFGQPDGSAVEVLALNRTRWAQGSPTFAICETGGDCLGLAWVNVSAGEAATGYVGYWLLPTARGRGLATRAVILLSRLAVDELGIARLRLLTEPANERSQRVAERSGFRRVALPPAHGEIDGRPVDHVLFELPPRQQVSPGSRRATPRAFDGPSHMSVVGRNGPRGSS